MRSPDLEDILSFMRKMKPKRTASHEDRDVSDSGFRINEPMPMKDKKPVRKNPNAVDNFWDTHQAEYDDREQPANRCSYVDSHNDACPKLKDEIDKKRDTSKPIACQASMEQASHALGIRCGTQTLVSERDWSDPKCIMCSERKRYARHLSCRKSRRDRRSRDCRVSKSRRRPPPRKKLIKINKAHSTSNESRESRNVERSKAEPKSSKVSTRYPDSTPSHTSYNSFLSMDHEPMV